MKKKRKKKTNTQSRLVLSRIGFPCPCCGEVLAADSGQSQYATLEHIVPLDHGGSNEPHNLDVICNLCNSARNTVKQHFENKHRHIPKKYWQESLRLPSSIYNVNRYFSEYHTIFLKARFG